MTGPGVVTANSLEGALEALAAGARPIAGGTDLVVGARQGKAALPDALVAIHRLTALHRLEERDGLLSIGPLVTHAELVAEPVVRERFPALADACAIVGSHATRAIGTIGGNVMNASPAMESGGPLVCCDAVAVLASVDDERRLSVADLLLGPGRTAARPDELLVALELPTPPAGSGSCYARLEYRRQMEIAVVGVTAAVRLENATVHTARVALTALGPAIERVPEAEAALVGTAGDDDAIVAAAAAAARAARPISDLRGTADYRRAMAEVFARRVIAAALVRARGGTIPIPAGGHLRDGESDAR